MSDDGKYTKRDYGPLTQEQAGNLADFAADRAQERMYAELGRSVVKKTLFLLGAGITALVAYLADFIHFGPR